MSGTATLATVLVLADGRLPTGAHANSNGAEWAVDHDDLAESDLLEAWLRARLDGPGTTEAAFTVAAAARLATADPAARLVDLDAELLARTPGTGARTVSRRLGRRFRAAARRIWPDDRHDVLDDIRLAHPDGPLQPLAVGVTAAVLELDPVDSAVVVLHHQLAAATTAVVRLLGADPVATAAVQARLAPTVTAIAAAAPAWATADVVDLPGHGPVLSEILTEHHQHRSGRLFVA